MAEQDTFETARLRRDLPRLARKLGRPPTREELAALRGDAALLKRLEAQGVVTSKRAVVDGSGTRRRVYSLRRFL